MALIIQKQEGTTTATVSKPQLCHTCRLHKQGLFRRDVYGKPQCADCARMAGHPIDD